MASRSRLPLALGGLLALYTYATFLRSYAPGAGDPGLFGYAPNFVLASVVGVLFAAGTAGHVADRGQATRLAWYPGWALVASLPLFVVLSLRGDPLGSWVQYPVVLGAAVGIGAEVRSWSGVRDGTNK